MVFYNYTATSRFCILPNFLDHQPNGSYLLATTCFPRDLFVFLDFFKIQIPHFHGVKIFGIFAFKSQSFSYCFHSVIQEVISSYNAFVISRHKHELPLIQVLQTKPYQPHLPMTYLAVVVAYSTCNQNTLHTICILHRNTTTLMTSKIVPLVLKRASST